MKPVYSVVESGRNGPVIAEAAKLWIQPTDVVLDCTYGRGLFWTKYRHPGHFIAHDRDLDGVSYLELPEPPDSIDVVVFDPPYVCAALDTEILTTRGWKSWSDLVVGEEVLTFNCDTGLAEWQPVQAVRTFPAPRNLIEMRSRSHSSLTTENHRWPVQTKRKDRPWELVRTDSFKADHVVPVAADNNDLPVEPKYTDAFVEAVAWFWTEGSIERLRDGSAAGYCNIVQSFAADDRCDRIRSCLRRLFGEPCSGFPRLGRKTDGMPRWRETRDGHKAVFWLSTDAGRLLQECAPERVPTFEFLLSLTRAQLALFIESSLLADGHVTVEGSCTLGQKNREAAESFQFAAVLAGYGTSIYPSAHPLGYNMWTVRLRRRRNFKPSRQTQKIVTPSATDYVWCPETPNGTWLARRDGTVYFTGNSKGGRSTSGIPDFDARYALADAGKSPDAVDTDVSIGMAQAYKVLRPGGRLFTKTMDYISSGAFHQSHKHVVNTAGWLGLEQVDEFVMVRPSGGPQPKFNLDGTPRRQVHSRRRHSFLVVFRKS